MSFRSRNCCGCRRRIAHGQNGPHALVIVVRGDEPEAHAEATGRAHVVGIVRAQVVQRAVAFQPVFLRAQIVERARSKGGAAGELPGRRRNQRSSEAAVAVAAVVVVA